MIQAIVFVEFHSILGPRLTTEYPSGFFQSLVEFDSISEYVIPKPELCNRLVSLHLNSDNLLLGFPVRLENTKYERNAYFFNVALIISIKKYTIYEGITRKLANIFTLLEKECDYLHNAETRNRIPSIFKQIMTDLNTYGETYVEINKANTINLRILPTFPQPKKISAWSVPVFVTDLSNIIQDNWDMTVIEVSKFIDGVRHISKISTLANIETFLVIKAIHHLMFYGCVHVIDIFQFSNCYIATSKIQDLFGMESLPLIASWFRYSEVTNIASEISIKYMSFMSRTFLRMLSWFTGGIPVSKICESHANIFCFNLNKQVVPSQPQALRSAEYFITSNTEPVATTEQWAPLKVDIRRWITFAVIHGFLRRIHEYPVYSYSNEIKEIGVIDSSAENDDENRLPTALAELMDGKYHMDSICTIFGVSLSDLKMFLNNQNDQNIIILRK